MLTSGSVFAGYRIERVLGAGGMGTVYLARSRDLPRYDAVKVLSPALSRDPNFRARFVREAEVAAGLSHPNIVSIYSRGEFEGQLWIAMQYVDGPDADSALKSGTMTPARAVYVVGEVAKALDYAHHHHVVHRDVKPANFLLSRDQGGQGRVLLGDFGIARALDDVGLTMTGAIVATVAYAAPEVLAGAPFDGRADLYSLGCTLFRLLTGKTPYPGHNGMAAVVAAHLSQPPPRVTEWAPHLPQALDAVIARAMAKDPAARFASGRELAQAANAALNDRSAATAVWQPIASSAVTGYQQTPNQGQWWQTTSSDPRTALAAAPPKPRRRRMLAAVAGVTAVAVAATVATVTLLNRDDERVAAQTTSSTSTPTETTTGLVRLTSLPALLLPDDQLTTLMGDTNLGRSLTIPLPLDFSEHIAQKDCTGAWLPADLSTYRPSGFDGLQVESFVRADEPNALSRLIQSVAAFPTVAYAREFFEAQRDQWGKCRGRPLDITFPDRDPFRISLENPTIMAGGVMMAMLVPENAALEPCFRAMALRNNVVVDVRACNSGNPAVALQMATAIAEKVPH